MFVSMCVSLFVRYLGLWLAAALPLGALAASSVAELEIFSSGY